MEEKGQLMDNRGLTKLGIEFVAKLHANGLGYRRIAKALGINPSAARYWIVKLGVNRSGKISRIAKCQFCGENFGSA